MSRMWQLFCSTEDPADAGNGSPWSGLAQVRIPLEHWEAIVEHVCRINPQQAALLDEIAILDGRVLEADQRAALLSLLEEWAERIAGGPALMPEQPTAEIPEPMDANEHARMLADIAQLLRRSMASGEPFDSWVD